MSRLLGGVFLVFVMASSAGAQVSIDDEARVLFDEGQSAYESGQFETARARFRRAYVLSGRYQMLFNVGLAELRLENDASALEAFEAYLEHAPEDATNRANVEQRVRVLREMGVVATRSLNEEEEVVDPVEGASMDVAGTDDAPSAGRPVGAFVLMGVGAAALVAGAVLLPVASNQAADVRDAPDGSRWSELEAQGTKADRMWASGWIAIGAGVAAAGAGLGWLLSSGDDDVQVSAGLGSVQVRGRF